MKFRKKEKKFSITGIHDQTREHNSCPKLNFNIDFIDGYDRYRIINVYIRTTTKKNFLHSTISYSNQILFLHFIVKLTKTLIVTRFQRLLSIVSVLLWRFFNQNLYSSLEYFFFWIWKTECDTFRLFSCCNISSEPM